MLYDFQKVTEFAKATFPLSLEGIHGLAHWQRVQENGLRLARHNGANEDIVRLFSMLHDCCREHDGTDPDHGPRAAALTEGLRNQLITAEDGEFSKLIEAIHGHTHVIKSCDVDIATCWDADRLDIGRVGVQPQKRYLNTEIAKTASVRKWAYERSLQFR